MNVHRPWDPYLYPISIEISAKLIKKVFVKRSLVQWPEFMEQFQGIYKRLLFIPLINIREQKQLLVSNEWIRELIFLSLENVVFLIGGAV